MIFNHIIELYIILCVSVIFHELAHVIAAKIIKLDIEEIHIGDEFMSFKIKKVFMSLNMLSGSYVSFVIESLKSKKKWQIAFFFLSGSIANLILLIIGYGFLNQYNIYATFIVYINAYLIMGNCIPIIIQNNDVGKMIKYLRNK